MMAELTFCIGETKKMYFYRMRKSISSVLSLIIFFLIAMQLQAQELEPKVAEFGVKPYERPLNTVEQPKLISPDEEALDTVFVVTLQELSQYYQSTRLVIAFTNNSPFFVDNFWIQVRLLDKNGSFLYREQPVLFTTVNAGRTVRGEVLCESIGTEEVGYVVIRPELLEIERNERPFESRFLSLKSTVQKPVRMVLSSMFE